MKISTILIILIFMFIMFMGGEFTKSGLDWYHSLKLPPGTPPAIVFSIVWIFLYTLIAICLVRIWKTKPKQFGLIMTLFVLNGLFNLAWSYLFFTQKRMLIAFIDLCFLWVSIGFIICLTYRSSKLNAYLLLPYALWTAYAGYLNLGLWWLNH